MPFWLTMLPYASWCAGNLRLAHMALLRVTPSWPHGFVTPFRRALRLNKTPPACVARVSALLVRVACLKRMSHALRQGVHALRVHALMAHALMVYSASPLVSGVRKERPAARSLTNTAPHHRLPNKSDMITLWCTRCLVYCLSLSQCVASIHAAPIWRNLATAAS